MLEERCDCMCNAGRLVDRPFYFVWNCEYES